MVTIRRINPEGYVTNLAVSTEQEPFVHSAEQMIEDVLEDVKAGSTFHYTLFEILADELPIGLVYYADLPELNVYNLCQFFIDNRYQGRGYGKAALLLVLERMREEGRYKRVSVTYHEGNDVALRLYESVGFVHTGAEFEGDKDMERGL